MHKVPQEVLWTIQQLHTNGYEAYLVGGSVRDIFLGRNVKDWDITTNAVPDQIIEVFEKTDRRVVYENNFGTVGIVNKDLDFSSSEYEIEITPYRTEGKYSDHRRPDQVEFAETIEEDLSRRDFTINAMAYDPIKDLLIDIYGGRDDLQKGVIATVGDAQERFSEDALRILRALRFSAQLGFSLTEETILGIKKQVQTLSHVSAERKRDELLKIFDAPHAKDAFVAMQKFGILKDLIPELEEGVACHQGGIHKFDVWTHLLKSLEHATERNYSLQVKIAALFHDIGKPRTRRKANGRGTKEWTFYGHEVVGAKISRDIMQRLKFPKTISDPVEKLVRYHMFFSDPDSITLSAVRRMVANVGVELIWELMNLRICDRIGTGRPTEKPYRLRKYHAMIEEVLRDPISVSMLKINGDIMIKELNMKPGKRMGWMLHALLEDVLDDPTKNNREYLEKKIGELEMLSDIELQQKGEAGKEKKDDEEHREIKKLHKKHNV